MAIWENDKQEKQETNEKQESDSCGASIWQFGKRIRQEELEKTTNPVKTGKTRIKELQTEHLAIGDNDKLKKIKTYNVSCFPRFPCLSFSEIAKCSIHNSLFPVFFVFIFV